MYQFLASQPKQDHLNISRVFGLIAPFANFDYERYLSSDGKQGVVESANKINGMLGEIADGVSCTKQQKMI